jgi:hypothetical protein
MSTDGGVDKGIRLLSLGGHIVFSGERTTTLTELRQIMEVLEPILNS